MKNSNSKGTLYLTLSYMAIMISAYVVNVGLGRFLGPAQYGNYGIIISIMTTVNLIQVSGLPQSVSRYIASNGNLSDSILKSGLILQLISTLLASLLLLIMSDLITSALKDSTLLPYVRLSTLILPIYGIYALYQGYYNGLHNFKKQATLNVIYSLSKAVFVVSLGIFLGIRGAIIGFILSPLTALAFGIRVPKGSIRIFSCRKLILFSLPLIGFAILSTLQLSVDLFFVKALTDNPEESGFYTANQNIAQIIFYGLGSFAIVLFPNISKSINSKNMPHTRKLIKSSLRYIIMLLSPGVLILSATSQSLLQLIYSDTYIYGSDSLSILVIGIGFLTLYNLLANILNGAGNVYNSLVLSGIGVLITIILCITLIPTTGLNGAALSTTIGSLISMFFSLIIVYRKFNQLIPLISFIKIISSSIVIYILALFINVPILLLPLIYCLYFLLYFSMLYFMRELNVDDFNEIKDLLPIRFLFNK